MKRTFLLSVALTFSTTFVIFLFLIGAFSWKFPTQGAPPYDSATDEQPQMDRFAWLLGWKRPDGPARVGLQVGHWKNDELPEELASLRGSTGASGGGKSEWEVNMSIAQETKSRLEARGIIVDILPATIPPRYWADVFIAIHADGNLDTRVRGYKAASPRRDMSGKSDELLASVVKTYGETTNLLLDPQVSRNMRGYYAFAWWRREHAVHPMATAIILETGFLTSPADRRIIVNRPELAAIGIAEGVITYLESQKLL